MTLFELFSLNPISACINILARSLEYEQRQQLPVIRAAVGWQPDESYTEQIDGNGVTEFVKTERAPLWKRMQG